MNKNELWDIIIEHNPSFVQGTVKMKPESFRKLFNLVWDLATECELERLDNIRGASLPPPFDQIFGRIK